MTSVVKTFCRLCEVGCGLEAHVEGGAITKIRPDGDHPVTKGFACNKGLLSLEIHRDPARLTHPQVRAADGTWADTSWDDALARIVERVQAAVSEHGPRAVGVYIGNPAAFNALGSMSAGLFARLLGTDRIFSAGTQDCANKFAIAEMLWGSPVVHLVPDLDRTSHLLVLGSNPRVSKGSFLSTPDPIGRFASIVERGGTVRFVDPRDVEPNVGEVVQVKPDTDVYLLAALLVEIDRSVGFDAAGAAQVRDLDGLRAFLAPFTPERVAPVVGIDAERIVAMAREFAGAQGAAIHVSTGVNMGRQGALAYWLAIMLSALTGNLDRAGGNIGVGRGLLAHPAERAGDEGSFEQSPWGPYRPASGLIPGALLADMIRADTEPLRVLFVVAGNPALSVGGGDSLAEALADLDLMVAVDLYRNATGELADITLPAADWYEREDINFFVQGTQLEPHVQWSGPVVDPAGERRTERAVFAELGTRLGLPELIPADADMLALMHDAALAEHGLSMAALRSEAGGVALLATPEPGRFLERHTVDGTLDGNPAMLAIARERAAAILVALEAEPADQLKLITRRTSHTLNSAMQNVERLKKGAADNPLHVSPADAERLGLLDGAKARVGNGYGSIDAIVKVDATLRPGVVAMTHGFGNAATSGMPVAQAYPGVNVNQLAPHGPGTFDPVSSQSQMTGIPVEVEAL